MQTSTRRGRCPHRTAKTNAYKQHVFGRSKPLLYGVWFRKTVGVAVYVSANDKKTEPDGVYKYAVGSVYFLTFPIMLWGALFHTRLLYGCS